MHNLKNAIKDYRYLKKRGYPEKAALQLVGDKYQLSRLARNCLFRGVVPAALARKRRAKIVPKSDLVQAALGIDFYNVLITIESYLKGIPLFLADDGILRDAAGVHGSYRKSKVTEQLLPLLIHYFWELEAEKISLFLDAPVPFSGEMAGYLREKIPAGPAQSGAATPGQTELQKQKAGCYSILLTPSADYELKNYPGYVASSDSVIIDKAAGVFDLPADFLQVTYHFTPPRLEDVKLNPA